MNKYFNLTILSIFTLLLTSCGVGSTSGTQSNATTNALNAGTTAGSLLGNVLTSLLSGTTKAESLVGTWTYSAPKVVFESENVLAKIGSTVASSKIESTLESQLKKVGFTAGATKMTFNSDNTCSLNVGGKDWAGTYQFDASTKTMTVTGAFGVGTMKCTATVSGNSLYMLFDADALLKLATNLTSNTSSSSISTILKSYNGLKLGWTMTK